MAKKLSKSLHLEAADARRIYGGKANEMAPNCGHGDFGKPRADLLRSERALLEQMDCDVTQAIAMRNNGLRCRLLSIRTSLWIG